MFTKDDYKNYFEEISDIFKDMLVNYTDLVNELNDRAIRNKISVLMAEDMQGFKFIKDQKEKFI